MELVVVEHDTSVELDARECTEVNSVELVSGSGRWMERSRDGRREYGRGRRR
jgi:hypothetical protein